MSNSAFSNLASDPSAPAGDTWSSVGATSENVPTPAPVSNVAARTSPTGANPARSQGARGTLAHLNPTTATNAASSALKAFGPRRRKTSSRTIAGLCGGLLATCTALAGITQTIPAHETSANAASMSRPTVIQTPVVAYTGPSDGLAEPAGNPELLADDAGGGVESSEAKFQTISYSTEGASEGGASSAAAARETTSAKSRVIWMEVTAYCACSKCCGDDARGITASGKTVRHNQGRFVAADTRVLPFGTRVSIPGYHNALPVEVIDRGKDIKGNRLDVFFPSHKTAQEFGRRWVKVTVAK